MASEEHVPLNFSDFNATLSTFRAIEQNGRIPSNFMGTLQCLLENSKVNPRVKPFISFYWDDKNRRFKYAWDMRTIKQATRLMEKRQAEENVKTDTSQTDPPVHSRFEELNQPSTSEARSKPTRSVHRQDHSASNECTKEVDGQILREWQRLIGRNVEILQASEFTKVGKILEQRTTDATLLEWIRKNLPNVIQKIKMWGCDILEPKSIKDLFKASNNEPASTSVGSRAGPSFLAKKKVIQQEENKVRTSADSLPLSRIDLITCMLNCVDVVVAQDLLRNMATFPVALPLIVPSVFERKMLLLVPLLKYISVRSRCSNSGDVSENFLFSSPFKLVLAVRLGMTDDVGKSCVLNCLLKRKYTFSSKQEPGAHFGKPLSLPGFVEFVPLTEETCSAELWKDITRYRENDGDDDTLLLLANMHGDPTDHPDVLRTMIELSSGMIVFTMPKIDGEKCEEMWQALAEVYGDDLPYLEVVAGNNGRQQDVINTGDLNNDETLTKVRDALLRALHLRKKETGEWKSFGNIHNVEEIRTAESSKLAEEIRKGSVRDVRSMLLALPGATSKNDFEEELIRIFCSILKLPLRQRILGILHFQKELSHVTNKQSFPLRNQLYRLQAKLTASKQVERRRKRSDKKTNYRAFGSTWRI